MEDKVIIRRLFIAIPELHFDIDFLHAAVNSGLIEHDVVEAAKSAIKKKKKWQAFTNKLRNKHVVQRITLVANELMSVQTVNLLRKMNLIDDKTGHAMRLAMRIANRAAATNVSEATILARSGRVLGVLFSKETVDLVKLLDDEQVAIIANKLREISGKKRLTAEQASYIHGLLVKNVTKAERLRGGVKAGKLIADAFKDAKNAQSLVQGLAMFGSHIWDHEMVRALLRARLITPYQANTLYSLVDIGMDAWRKIAKSFEYSSWAARAMMVAQGFITPETISLAVHLGYISPTQARYMYAAAAAIRIAMRAKINQLEGIPGRKFRHIPGKNPIQVFARASSVSDAQILRLLSEASRDASREAAALMKAPGFGAKTRARQQQIIAAKLHEEMRIMWENVGHMTIFGEKQAAQAAVQAMNDLQESLYGGKAVGNMLNGAGRSGVDSYISRQENLMQLSDRVYSNWMRSKGALDREINKSLLRGQSASEMAQTIEKYINPNTPGGASYAAMRLSRTEINNAFHLSCIRYTREMPWVRGYKWELSGSHGRPDICNDYATRVGKLGKGCYTKGEIPNKPHPQCLCYITTIVDPLGDFEKGLKNGKYDRYLDQMNLNGLPGEGGGIDLTNAAMWAAEKSGAFVAQHSASVLEKGLDTVFSKPTFLGKKVSTGNFC